MEIPNKKTMFSIFAGCVFLQMVFILTLSANFLMAQTDSYSENTPSIEIKVADSEDRKNFRAASNAPLEKVTFYFDNLSDSSATPIHFSAASSDLTKTNWSLNLSDGNLTNSDDYNFYAIGFYEGKSYKSANYIFIPANTESADSSDDNYYSDETTNPDFDYNNNTDTDSATGDNGDINNNGIYNDSSNDSYDSGGDSSSNTITDPLTLTFIERFESPFFGDQQISISSNQEINECAFKIYGPKYIEFPGIKDSPTKCHILLRAYDFPDGYYTIKAVAKNDTETAEIRLDVKIENQSDIAPESDQPPTEPVPIEPFYPADPTKPVSTEPFYPTKPPLESIPTEPFYPTKPIEPLPTEPYPVIEPPTDFITSFEDMLAVIPPECKERNLLTPEECQKYMQIPFECIQQDIADPEKCKEYMFKYAMPRECVEQGATTHEECAKIVLLNSFPPECRASGAATKEECERIMSTQFYITEECRNANIATPEECDRYMMNNFMPEECRKENAATKEECDYILRNKYGDFENLTVRTEMPFIGNDATPSMEKGLPPECLDRGINSFEECEKHMTLIHMPEECREANAATTEECEKIMFGKYGPRECIEANIFEPEECEKYMFKKFAPDDCREAGILNPEACKKYMFEKYNGAENIPQDKFPIECQKANATTADKCDKVMRNIYLPKECKEQEIDDEEKCDLYLQQKHMPKECREAEARSRSECDKIMFKKFGPPECQEAGIEDEKECREFMFNKYAPKVKCDNLEDWQCKNFIKDKHLGNIVAKQAIFGKLKENVAYLTGKTIESEELKEKVGAIEEVIPIKEKGIKFKIISGEGELILNEEDNLIQTAPIILMIDGDMDGLPDDLEKRLGTDPAKADTDGDGYSDGEEVKNGYNPLGDRELGDKISPIDEAILQNKTLGHPKVEGEETENIAIKNIANLESERGYILSGKSEPNSVVTLYIYSDLPLVITTKTDEYGNWRYELNKPLVDGEHEVYVAINDNTGKVVNKSKPLNFFVKEAGAVSVKDFISPIASAASETEKDSNSSIYYYLITALLLIIIGISFFVAMIMKKKTGNRGIDQ